MFDYSEAVKADVKEFLMNSTIYWNEYSTADEWITEMRKSLELRSFVIGMDDNDMFTYNGSHPAEPMDIVRHMSEVVSFMTENMDAEEIDTAFKEHGLGVIDCIAREIAYSYFIRTPEFQQMVTEAWENWQMMRFTKGRKALIRMMESGMCTPTEALDAYDQTLRDLGFVAENLHSGRMEQGKS